jgi:hypothetical protein
MKRTARLIAFFLLFLNFFPRTGSSQVYYPIPPGDEAVISFHLGSPTPGVDHNLLYLGAYGTTIATLTSTSYSLYDGDSLLATTIRPGMDSMTGQAFRSFDNSMPGYVSGPSIPTDFTSIRDGSIKGLLIFEPIFTNPAKGDQIAVGFDMQLVEQVSFNSGSAFQAPIIDSIQIVTVPEPSVLALTVIGLGCVISANITRRPPRRWHSGKRCERE